VGTTRGTDAKYPWQRVRSVAGRFPMPGQHETPGRVPHKPARATLTLPRTPRRLGLHANREPPLIGRTLSHYEILELLGKGGMGEVYRARDVRLDRDVALKVLPSQLMRDAERRSRFIQEAKAASAVNHPAIAQIYDISDEDDVSFIAMEYIEGSTVRQLIERGELDVGSAVEIGVQVAGALGRAHEAGIVHRDIKSDNIMVTRDGHPKVLDFGLAKLTDPDGSPDEMATVAMTHAGMVMGTVSYMSPEQARGLGADQRSDIFSLGIVLYEMATGQLPFQGESALDTMHAIAFTETQPIQTLRAGLPHSLQRVIDRCLQKDAADRYPQMAEMAEDLQTVKRELESGVTRASPIMDRWGLVPRRVVPPNLTTRGLVLAIFWTFLLGALTVTVLFSNGGMFGVLPFLVVGLIVFARFRSRSRRLARKFVKKARKLDPVRLVSLTESEFTVLMAEDAPARTYVKLNSLLESLNGGLYMKPEFTMVVRDDASVDEVKALVTGPGLQFARDDV